MARQEQGQGQNAQPSEFTTVASDRRELEVSPDRDIAPLAVNQLLPEQGLPRQGPQLRPAFEARRPEVIYIGKEPSEGHDYELGDLEQQVRPVRKGAIGRLVDRLNPLKRWREWQAWQEEQWKGEVEQEILRTVEFLQFELRRGGILMPEEEEGQGERVQDQNSFEEIPSDQDEDVPSDQEASNGRQRSNEF